MKNTNPKAVLTVGDLDGISLVQAPDGKVSAVSSTFSFNKLTGLAEVTKPDGSVLASWQCSLLKDTTSEVIGWVWPSVMQADLPAPDVNVTDGAGTIVGRAYSVAIPNFWDTPVADAAGTVTHYGASALLPDGTYVAVTDLSGTVTTHYLTP